MYNPMGTDQIANSVGPSPRTLIDQTSEHNSVFKWTWLAAHLVLFIGFSYFSFSRNYGVLSIGVDGANVLWNVMYQWIWAPAAVGLYSSPFQGLSDLWWGTNSKLIPGYFLPMLILGNEGVISPGYIVLSYVTFSTEMFLSTLVLARALGMSWSIGIICAWLLPLLAQPYFGFSLIYPMMMLSPSYGSMVANFSFLLAAISYLGRDYGEFWHTLRRNLLPSLAIPLLLIVMIGSNPLMSFLWAPVLTAASLGLIAGATGRERLLKFSILAFFAVILLVSGAGAFVLGLFSFTVPRFWPEDLENVLTGTHLVSIWYYGAVGPMGAKVVGFGIFGMVLALAFGDRRLRWCAASMLTIVAFIFALGYSAIKWGFWRGPAPIYFEFLMWPAYVIFAVWGIAFFPTRLLDLLKTVSTPAFRWARSERASIFVMLVLLVAIPVCAFWHAWPVNNLERTYAIPPSKSAMIALLKEQVGLTPGAPFRGRVVTMEFVHKAGPIEWMDVANKVGPRYAATGNDYWTGLWYHDIPTLFQYTSTVAPDFFRAVTRMLADTNDRQRRGAILLRRPDAHALGILGVRFVISDAELPEPFHLVMTEHMHNSEVFFLYEVPDVNLGINAPTEVRVVSGFDEAVNQLADIDFDRKRSVLVFDTTLADNHLTPVDSAQVRMVPGGFFVEAHSPATSLLVLPFQFSQCLQVHNSAVNVDAPRLFRVNAIETGVLFNRHLAAKIEFFTGVFHNSGCRWRDSQDFSKLLATN
jgi:hypothetical protein